MSVRVKIFLALLLSLQCFFGFAQVKKQNCGSVACDSFQVFEEDKKLKLPSLLESKDSIYFRYYKACNVVDVWSKDGVSFKGRVTTYTYKFYDKKKQMEESPSRYFFTKEILDPGLAREVYDLSCRISSVPTGASIKEEQDLNYRGRHPIILTTGTSSCICQKSYREPFRREAPEIVQKLNPLLKAIDSILGLDGRRDTLIAHLKPNQYYYRDNYLTFREHKGRKGKKLDRELYNNMYLDSISESLNKYLSDTLTSIFTKMQPIKCYTEFILHFDPQNALTKITTTNKFDSKTERQEFKKYCQLIRDAFKNADLSFVHSALNYRKTLEFREGKVSVGDFYGP